jgi:hypothetical protein
MYICIDCTLLTSVQLLLAYSVLFMIFLLSFDYCHFYFLILEMYPRYFDPFNIKLQVN